jgi:hypothetical protein
MPERTLGQIIAVEKAARQKDNTEGGRIKRDVQKEVFIRGKRKTYTPDDNDAPDYDRPADLYEPVHLRVEDALREARKYAVPAINTTGTKDRTNTEAVADLVVNGRTIAVDLSVPHLLWLEGWLAEWKSFISVLPVLDPAHRWAPNESTGLYESEPEVTARNLKEKTPLVLIAPTQYQPGVAETYMKETHVGTYTTTILSGAVSKDRKQQLLDRFHDLSLAVREAVAVANRTPAVEETAEGDALMDYLLG